MSNMTLEEFQKSIEDMFNETKAIIQAIFNDNQGTAETEE